MKNDKLLHFLVGGSIGLLTLPLAFYIGIWWSMWVITFCSPLVFITKEVYDMYKPHPTGFDKMDLLADYVGMVGGFIISFFVYGIIQILQL